MATKAFSNRKFWLVLFLLFRVATLVAQNTDHGHLSGKWQLTIASKEDQKHTVQLDLVQNGSLITGTFTDPKGDVSSIENGKLDGNTCTFDVVSKRGRHSVEMDFSGRVVDVTIDFTITVKGKNRAFQAIAQQDHSGQ